MKNDRASRANDAHAVLDKFSAVRVSYWHISLTSVTNGICFFSFLWPYLVATRLNRHRFAEFGKAHERLIYALRRLGC